MSAVPPEHARLLHEIKALQSQNRHLQARIEQLEEEKRRLLHRQYGPSSEQAPSPQMRLFNEPEAIAAVIDDDSQRGLTRFNFIRKIERHAVTAIGGGLRRRAEYASAVDGRRDAEHARALRADDADQQKRCERQTCQ